VVIIGVQRFQLESELTLAAIRFPQRLAVDEYRHFLHGRELKCGGFELCLNPRVITYAPSISVPVRWITAFPFSSVMLSTCRSDWYNALYNPDSRTTALFIINNDSMPGF